MRSRLEPVRRYGEHSPYTTLEPCGLCVGAAIMVTDGRVCFASNDLYAGGPDSNSTTHLGAALS